MSNDTIERLEIPSFEEIMLPLLTLVNNDQEHYMRECVVAIADHFNLSPEQRSILKSSSKTETVWNNHVHWARQCLKRGGLLEDPKRGYTKITQKGKEWLKKDLDSITTKDLKTIPEYSAWEATIKARRKDNSSQNASTNETPYDVTIQGITTVNENTKFELLEKMRHMDVFEFERVNAHLLQALGYGDAKTTRKSGDYGIDGYTTSDRLGFDKIRFQSKRYTENVSAAQVREFLGSIGPGKKGVMITTSDYSPNLDKTLKESERSPDDIKFINGEKLVDLMLECKIGVKIADTFNTYEIDDEFFESTT